MPNLNLTYMNKTTTFLSMAFILISTYLNAQTTGTKLVDFVNPFIGTGAIDSISLGGNNFPGAALPFGLIQLSPDTKDAPDEPCSGYNYKDNIIYGFSHTHLSGTGIGDLFDVMVMPTVGESSLVNEKGENLRKSKFSHDQETARPGYYQVKLLDYNINAELTVTEHVGFHRYTFPQSKQAHIVFDLKHIATRDWGVYCKVLNAQIRVINNTTIEGYRFTTGWFEGVRKAYFTAEFSKPFKLATLKEDYTDNQNPFKVIALNSDNATTSFDGNSTNLNILNGKALKALLDFNTTDQEKILVKVGLSSVSCENARLNLRTELPGWDFELAMANAEKTWEHELEKIQVEGTIEQKQIFYTAMYHAFLQPNNIADVNGDYMASDMTIRNAPDKKHYSTFSLWDTYRAAHPLYTLIQPERTANFINSMLRQYETFGFLPIWQLWGLENYCMIGNHAIPVITDAALKGLKGFDLEKAYEAVKGSLLLNHSGAPYTAWEKYGYIPEDVLSQSVSITLEMAYDDWCVAQFAKKLGKMTDYERFIKRSAFYKNIFDTKSKFFRGRYRDGSWFTPFEPLAYGGNGGFPYTEGNAWQYLFYVPQDVPGLIDLLGGKECFTAKLDTFFSLNVVNDKNENVSGMIGQYAHGNEPSHHAAYLYDFAGQPWKTQKYVAQVLTGLYHTTSAGYSGNDDCGQMSAWYIFSSMGFYPVNPANGVYAIGSPILEKAAIHLANGKTFTVSTTNVSATNVYIQSAKLNGKAYSKAYILQGDIANGGTLEFVMGNKPNKMWGATEFPLMWGY